MNYRILVTAITFILLNTNGFISQKLYNKHSLIRVIPADEIQLEFTKKLDTAYDANFWRFPGQVNKPFEFAIEPSKKETFLREAKNIGLNYTTLIDDLQEAFEQQTVRSYDRRNQDSFNWNHYYRVDDINRWLWDLSEQYPKLVKVWSIGQSFEGRDILVLRLAFPETKKRSVIIVEGGIHAREWVSSAFVTNLLFKLLHSTDSTNNKLKHIAYTYEWYFVPMLNPDGYEYTHTKDRQWRKNRNGSGVDINRNFDIAFGTVGISKNPNSEVFCGTHAFSESESEAMAIFVKSHCKHIEYYLAFHSYGQYMILPYAYLKTHHDNFEEVKQMAEEAGDKIKEKHGTQYVVGTAFDTVGYTTAGVSGCWAKKTCRIPYVVTFELRDEGRYGFALPAAQILPTCQETLDGIISLVTPRKISFKLLQTNNQPRNVFDIFLMTISILLLYILD